MNDTAILTISGFSKTFAGRTVLKDARMEIARGEVRGLVGQNGSGKSTLIKLLSGIHPADPGGSLRIRGLQTPLPLTSDACRNLGIACVHQDLGLILTASVMENIRIGRYKTGFGGRVSWRSERQKTRESLDNFGLSHVSPDALITDLLDVDKAIVAIIRAVEQVSDHTGGLLILDEPTVYLPKDSVTRLFSAVRRVSQMGHGVLFVSHNLTEVLELTDRVTVLRDGRIVEELESEGLTEDRLITAILGFALGDLYPTTTEGELGPVVLSARGITGGSLRPFSFELHRGEILGFTGLAGMGHEDLPYLLFGASSGRGTLEIDSHSVDLARMSPQKAIRSGLALLPGNRAQQGGVGIASARENATLPTIKRDFSGWRLRTKSEKERAWRMVTDFRASPRNPEQMFAAFSGGNQQKILVAKWFETNPRVFMVHEPTQGVDIGSRKEIFQAFRQAANSGTSFIMASNEYEDLAHICDRVIVFKHGAAAATLTGRDLTADRLIDQCLRAA